MRLRGFVNENKFVGLTELEEKLTSNYSEILNLYKKSNGGRLYRASDDNYTFVRKVPRQERGPRDTVLFLHKILDNLFNERFGWKPRSTGVFVSASRGYINSFGERNYIIFPSNGFKYILETDETKNIWSYIYGCHVEITGDDTDISILREIIKKYYNDKGLEAYLEQGDNAEGEVVIKCNNYYSLYDNWDNRKSLSQFLGLE